MIHDSRTGCCGFTQQESLAVFDAGIDQKLQGFLRFYSLRDHLGADCPGAHGLQC